MKYLSNRVFRIWAYTVSHCFLILRSPMIPEDVEGFSEDMNYNIDIEFTAVAYMDIPSSILDIDICELNEDVPEKFQYYKDILRYKVFRITSNKRLYYIIAGSYRIGTNKWVNEDRISNMYLEYDEILATS